MSEVWMMYEGNDDDEYVVYRTGYPQEPVPLNYLPAKQWDDYILGVPDTKCVEISRGHTLSEAINLTVLANGGNEE